MFDYFRQEITVFSPTGWWWPLEGQGIGSTDGRIGWRQKEKQLEATGEKNRNKPVESRVLARGGKVSFSFLLRVRRGVNNQFVSDI